MESTRIPTTLSAPFTFPSQISFGTPDKQAAHPPGDATLSIKGEIGDLLLPKIHRRRRRHHPSALRTRTRQQPNRHRGRQHWSCFQRFHQIQKISRPRPAHTSPPSEWVSPPLPSAPAPQSPPHNPDHCRTKPTPTPPPLLPTPLSPPSPSPPRSADSPSSPTIHPPDAANEYRPPSPPPAQTAPPPPTSTRKDPSRSSGTWRKTAPSPPPPSPPNSSDTEIPPSPDPSNSCSCS